MANIQINQLLETTTAQNNDYIAIDNGSATKKIKVSNFNATGAASAAQSAAAAAQSATDAENSKIAAEQAEDDTQALITSAQTIVSDAQTYANEASTSAGTASTAANTATAQAAIATNQANLAAGYAQNVDTFAKTAKSWAVGGTGTRQGEDTDNSKYYADSAHASEINAAASETAAAASEVNAAASESNAATSESNAATSEANAAQSESNASTSETNAALSATNAATSATNAAASETNAAASESSADLSSEDSEAWAVGQRNGVDVPPSDPAYHNNAKYWADVASGGVSGVSSFNGRSGNVVPALGDYAANIVEFDNTSSSLQSTTTQDAIEEVQDNVDDVASDLSTLDASLKPVAKSGAYSDLTGTPTLATVATSGSYNDLSNKPTLGTAAAKNSTDAVTPGSTALVESGAVYDIADGLNNAILGNATAIAKAYKYDDTADTAIDDADYIPFYDTSAGTMKKISKANADSAITSEIADMNNVLGAKNLLPNDATTQTVNGVTFTVNSDGSITANGTASANIAFLIDNTKTYQKGRYIANGCPIGGGFNQTYILWVRNSSEGLTVYDEGNGVEFELQHDMTLDTYIVIYEGQTVDLTFYPMIRPASIADDTYVPYAMTNRELTERIAIVEGTTPATTTDSNTIVNFPNGFTMDNSMIISIGVYANNNYRYEDKNYGVSVVMTSGNIQVFARETLGCGKNFRLMLMKIV